MKTRIKDLFLLPGLLAALNLLPAVRVAAQTFTTLHSFTAVDQLYLTNSDGANPFGDLITNSSGNILYGTAYYGGTSGWGTVFKVNTDGTGFTNIYSFAGGGYGSGPVGLILSSNTLYGTTRYGGNSGTVFAVNTDGTGFTNLYNFNGLSPNGGLIFSGNRLFGTTQFGGSFNWGTLFAVNTDGTGFTNLYNFNGLSPNGGLILSGNTLYGTMQFSGSSGALGTLFAVNTDGTGFTNLHNFSSRDGHAPGGGLILSGNTLYGTAGGDTAFDNGRVFAIHTDGTGFTNLYSFLGDVVPNGPHGLILSANTLYGVAASGGSLGYGYVFALNTDGTGFTTLHSFTTAYPNSVGVFTNSDGFEPTAGLTLSGNTLYGAAPYGGVAGNGTVFSISFRPQLTISHVGTNVILSWPISYAGFDYTGYILQETANLGSPTDWRVSDFFPPVIVNGQIRLTGPMLGPQRYYRLSK